MNQRLEQLAINKEGFVFDPMTGESYTVNPCGIACLLGLQQSQTTTAIAQHLADEFEVSVEQAERDIADFISHLQSHRLL